MNYQGILQSNLFSGTPIKHLTIHCYSLFRDVDFHARFHYDHYEYKGNYHGQYRGYQHGRVHQADSNHDHLIGVATALELSMGGTWISSVSILLGKPIIATYGVRTSIFMETQQDKKGAVVNDPLAQFTHHWQ